MPYTDNFITTDDLIARLVPIVPTISDPIVITKFIGLLSVSAVTVYELAIKEVLYDFAYKKNKVFGNYIEKQFERINGKIQISDLKGETVKKFGMKYKLRFDKKIDIQEKRYMRMHSYSITSSYTNLINCRHGFVHKGTLSMTFQEVIDSYNRGKVVINCLYESMRN